MLTVGTVIWFLTLVGRSGMFQLWNVDYGSEQYFLNISHPLKMYKTFVAHLPSRTLVCKTVPVSYEHKGERKKTMKGNKACLNSSK